MEKIVRTICQGCHSECGVLVHADNGRVTKIKPDPDHPSSRGHICIKGLNQHHFLNHPARIKNPLKRVGEKGGGKWAPISWDEALDEIAGKLTALREKHGGRSLGAFHGTAPRQGLFYTRLLASSLGTPNVCSTDLHFCYAPSMVSEMCTFGCSIMLEQGPDYRSSKCILVCGSNPVISHPPRGRDLLEGVRENQAKLIVIDPRRTELAARADVFFQARPGTVLLVLMGMLHTIISEGLYDKSFTQKYCHGFDELVRHIQDYAPEKFAATTWIPAAEIKKAARLFATTKPALINHRVGIEQELNSTQTVRALNILAAITGNIGIKGANLLPTHIPGYISTGGVIHFCQIPPEIGKDRIGGELYPLTAGQDPVFSFVHSGLAARAMLEEKPYPLKALMLASANPVVNMPDTKKAWRAFKQLDLFVVNDFFMTPTAELADYVLPTTMWLERDECCDEGYMACAAARQRVVAPPPQCRDDVQIAIDIAKKIPWANRDYLPWDTSAEFNDFRVKGMGITFEDLKKVGYVTVDTQYRQYETDGFPTPTGKIEIYSTRFKDNGHAPLPFYTENPHTPVSTPELLTEYPHILVTGGRTIEYYLSAGRQIDPLRKRCPDPLIEMHPETAAREKLKEGDWVFVETPMLKNERAKFRVALTPDFDPRVVHAQHGWWFPENPAPDHGCFESNINTVLVDEPPREEVCGSVCLRATLCKIYPCADES